MIIFSRSPTGSQVFVRFMDSPSPISWNLQIGLGFRGLGFWGTSTVSCIRMGPGLLVPTVNVLELWSLVSVALKIKPCSRMLIPRSFFRIRNPSP